MEYRHGTAKNNIYSLEDRWDPENRHTFEGGLEQCNEPSIKLYFIDCSPVSDWLYILIGPSGLLLVVSHLLPVPVFLLWVRLEKS